MSSPVNSASITATVDDLCDRFEDALQAGERPALDRWLSVAALEASAALPELVALELDYRLRGGEPVTAADYFHRFPELTFNSAAAVRLVAVEYRATAARDPQSSEARFRSRYPELAGLPDWSSGPWTSGNAAETRIYPTTPRDTPGESATDKTDPVDFLRTFLAPPDRPTDLGRIGEYHIREVVGAGGMGVVLTAEDPRLRRTVAIKLMRPEVAAMPGAKEHFLREARAAAAVEHPRIVVIHHVGEWNGTPFLVMPLMAGRSLGQRLKEAPPIPLADAVRMAREAADGLAAAHARGLIHRDIKPDNIWLEETADGTHVRLLDFGLVHENESDSQAQPGMIVGTPNYMAPEQAAGRPVDGRADLFSLGCVLYEVLTGRKVFCGTTALAVLTALANASPVPVQDLASNLPGALARLTMQLLEKDPARRPASAHALSAELKRIEQELAAGVDTVIIETAPPTPIWFHAPRWIWGVAGMLMVGVVGLIGHSLINGPGGGPDQFHVAQDDAPRLAESPPSPRYLEMVAARAQAKAEPLKVAAIDVEHIATTPLGDIPQGHLGAGVFTPALGDRVQVTANLSKPAYAFLLAFQPDGKARLCFPNDDAVPPPLTDTPRYPFADGQKPYLLEQEAGLWVFAVVASESPLPPYREWVKTHFNNALAWQPAAPPPTGLAWRDDDATRVFAFSESGEKQLFLQPEPPLEGPAAAIRKLTAALLTAGQAETVSAIGFRVAPKE